MQISHDALVKKVSVSEANPGYTAAQDGLAMNFEQKRRLSIAIGQLPGDRVSEVLKIISEQMPQVNHIAEGLMFVAQDCTSVSFLMSRCVECRLS